MTAPRLIALAVAAGLVGAFLIGRCSDRPVLWQVPAKLHELLGLDHDEDQPPAVPQALPGEGDPVEMVLVPGGSFQSGVDDDKRGLVRRTLEADAFWIDVHEVTNQQYARFVSAVEYPPPPYWDDRRYARSDLPVLGVSWHDARAYCWWTHKRLPGEAEWTKAAHGLDGRPFPWGGEYSASHANLLGLADGFAEVAPVGSFPNGASPFGVLDMTGNVWEWCRDWYDPLAYRALPSPGDVDDEIRRGSYRRHHRVIRGGSWVSSPELVRGLARDGLDPSVRGVHFGFRCARDPD